MTSRLRQEPKPFRVSTSGVYQGSYLMAHDIQTMLGYHGQEIRFYDELLGGKGQWRYAGNPNLLDLLGVRFLLLPEAQAVPGFHQVIGPGDDDAGAAGGSLRARYRPALCARRGRARPSLPRSRSRRPSSIPRFPYNARRPLSGYRRALRLRRSGPARCRTVAVAATVADGRPGSMRVTLAGRAPTADVPPGRRELVPRLARRRWTASRCRCSEATTRC